MLAKVLDQKPQTAAVEYVLTMVISPEQAAKWIAIDSSHNRPIARGVVKQYAEDMVNDRWKLNGETIKISVTGRVLDGQHRLRACIKAEVPFVSSVVFGLSDDVFDTVDRGYTRSAAQLFAIAGEKNASLVSGSLRILYALQSGAGLSISGVSVGKLRELLTEYPTVRHWATYLHSRRTLSKLMNPSTAVALAVLFGLRDTELTEAFFEALNSGGDAMQPVAKLRQKLLTDRLNAKRSLGRDEQAALTIKAWNAVRDKKEINQLRWRQGGESAETMPLIN